MNQVDAEGSGTFRTIARTYKLPASRRSRTLVAAGALLMVMVLLSIVVPILSPFEPNGQDLAARLEPPGWTNSEGLTHWFGTDALGRDVLVRVFVGARFSLTISVASVIAMFVVGTTLGLIAGLQGGRVDGFIMRLVDLQMAFPVVLLSIALVALLGPSFINIIFVFMVTGWPVFARTARGSTLGLKQKEFVEAALALGIGRARLMFREILPNVVGPLLVIASIQIAEVIVFESSLSFLGLGIQPPTPTWGGMMADGRDYLDPSWWVMFFPGIALMLAAIGANRLGNGYGSLLSGER